MKSKIAIWAVCSAVLFAWAWLAFAQTEKPAAMKTVKLTNGQEVFDISGEWDVLTENYGVFAIFGTYSNVAQITIRKSDGSFHAVRMKDNPPTAPKPAGSLIMIGNLDKNGITKLDVLATEKIPSTWNITENGNKIDVDAPNKVRMIFTRK
jgi:hypothetical protein